MTEVRFGRVETSRMHTSNYFQDGFSPLGWANKQLGPVLFLVFLFEMNQHQEHLFISTVKERFMTCFSSNEYYDML